VDRIAAEFAQKPGLFLIGRLMVFEFIFCCMALFANCEWISFFNSHYRDKKDIQVIVDSSLIGLLHSANRTPPGVIFYYFRFGGYAGNKKKHTNLSRVQGSAPPLAKKRLVKSNRKPRSN
jgi:hypothetical protein